MTKILFHTPVSNAEHPQHGHQQSPKHHPLSRQELQKLAKAEKRKRRRATPKYRHLHASRERVRVESFNRAFARLRTHLPVLPTEKKLSKIEILRVSIAYIHYLEFLLAL